MLFSISPLLFAAAAAAVLADLIATTSDITGAIILDKIAADSSTARNTYAYPMLEPTGGIRPNLSDINLIITDDARSLRPPLQLTQADMV